MPAGLDQATVNKLLMLLLYNNEVYNNWNLQYHMTAKDIAPAAEPSALRYDVKCASIASTMAVCTSSLVSCIPTGEFSNCLKCNELPIVSCMHLHITLASRF